jgi:hypothetical protein
MHPDLPDTRAMFSDPGPFAYVRTAHAGSDTLPRQGRKLRRNL